MMARAIRYRGIAESPASGWFKAENSRRALGTLPIIGRSIPGPMGSVQEKHLQVCESEESISMRRMSRLATAQFAFFARLCSTGGTADCECLLWAASLH